jgi:hypothetical protein
MAQDGHRQDLSDVLAEELEAIKGPVWVAGATGATVWLGERLRTVGEQAAQSEQCEAHKDDAKESGRRRALYGWFYEQGLSALCLSGGGIRSAAISLGVIQSLVDHKLLHKFNYLSTVSGGGYIGSWLSALLHHTKNADTVIRHLGSQRLNSDFEPPPLEHLRSYSNYLTPKLGLFSADTWTALAIVLRNIVVNWLILMPFFVLLVIGVKLLALGLDWRIGPVGVRWSVGGRVWVGILAFTCLIAGAMGFGYKLGRLYMPARSEMSVETGNPPVVAESASESQSDFQLWSLLPATVAGFLFVWLALQGTTPALGLVQAVFGQDVFGQDVAASANLLVAILLFAFPVYVIAIGVAGLWRKRLGVPVFPKGHPFGLAPKDYLCWVGGVLTFAALVWAGASAIHGLPTRIVLADAAGKTPIIIMRESLVVVFGMPWFLTATMFAHFIYLLLRSHSRKGEVEREWLGRASGWHFIAALAWIILSAIVLLGPAIYYNIPQTVHVLTVVSGAVTAVIGKSGFTPAKGAAVDWTGIGANIVLAIAGPLFAVLVLILLSVIVDWSVIGGVRPCFPTDCAWDCHSWWWLLPIIAAAGVLWAANYFSNINAFSLHAVYRNRLIRAFVGGARAAHRHPDGFTDFDWDDDLRVASLWSRTTLPTGENWRPFHIINMTLNLAATDRLAWQQRKAMPFSVTPFTCGNADLGYRATEFYGGPRIPPGPNGEIRSGISLGTAMAISGAAVSSNMGYHSSMSLSFLLTFFNVRLGVWLGNPKLGQGPHAPYTHTGPHYAVRSLLRELFGLTTDKSPYVYLSDGGHFEDLGLYEMVRRRCRRIVIVDGDQDAARGFEDLGNAVRKIWIDLGVQITFEASPLLTADKDAKLDEIPYLAVGTIRYLSDDPDAAGKAPKGQILYIKPVVRGDESAADVIAYKRANPAFPAQSTAEQWFDESQFESYRRLGHLMTERIIKATGVDKTNLDLKTLFDNLDKIDLKNMAVKK